VIDRWATDRELVADLRAGDGDAWTHVYVRFTASMRSVAGRFGPVDQVDDVVHEVFAQFCGRPDLFDPTRGSLRGYLLRMTKSRSIDAYREDVARRGRETRHLDHQRSRSVASVEGDAIDGIATDELIMIIRMLPRAEREAIGVAFFRYVTYQEAAVVLGIPEGTAKSRIRAGLLRMRAALGELGLDEGTLNDDDAVLSRVEVSIDPDPSTSC